MLIAQTKLSQVCRHPEPVAVTCSPPSSFHLLTCLSMQMFSFVFIPVLTSCQIRISRGSDDEDGAEWLNGSKSFEELSNFKDEMDPRRVVTRQKKSRTSKLIARIFKRKTMTPGSLKQSQVGGSTMMVNRCSRVGDESSVDRERSLTTSVSMPDITSEFCCIVVVVVVVVFLSNLCDGDWSYNYSDTGENLLSAHIFYDVHLSEHP